MGVKGYSYGPAQPRSADGRFARTLLRGSPKCAADTAQAAAAEFGSRDTSPSEPITSADDLMDVWEGRGVDSFVSETGDRIVVAKVVVPAQQRGSGTGTAFMTDVCDLADRTGRRVELSPSSDFGGTKSRLKAFYGRFGFVENKGRYRDFEVSEAMYRPPSNT